MTHKWDYEHPINLWERWPFWVRWPMLFLMLCYMVGSAVAFTIAMSRLP